MFTLKRGAGDTWLVSETAAAEPEPDSDMETQEQVARAFYDKLMADGALRRQCESRSGSQPSVTDASSSCRLKSAAGLRQEALS